MSDNINGSIRDLEGIINRIIAQAYILNHKIDKNFLKKFFSENHYMMPKKIVTIDGIKKLISDKFEIAVNDLDSARKSRNISRPRQMAMYLCKKHTMKSYVEIARNFGGKDHSTVINAVKSVESLLKNNKEVVEIISDIETSLS